MGPGLEEGQAPGGRIVKDAMRQDRGLKDPNHFVGLVERQAGEVG